jgi:hypothetical protein
MEYRVEQVDAVAGPMASRRRRVARGEIPGAIRELLDEVWAFLRAGGAPTPFGHNVCVYRNPSTDGIDLEAGVQVAAAFEGDAAVECSRTPGGRAIRTVHVGGHARLGGAHDALGAWCRDHGEGSVVVTWEVYGDWHEDPAQLMTEVYRLL